MVKRVLTWTGDIYHVYRGEIFYTTPSSFSLSSMITNIQFDKVNPYGIRDTIYLAQINEYCSFVKTAVAVGAEIIYFIDLRESVEIYKRGILKEVWE